MEVAPLADGTELRANGSHIRRRQIPASRLTSPKSQADFIRTELEEAVSRSADERALNPLCKLSVHRRCVMVLSESQSAVRRENRG